MNFNYARLSSLPLVFALLSGCASTLPVIETKIARVDLPAINVITKRELGDTLLSYTVTSTKPSVRTLGNLKYGSKVIPPQTLIPNGGNRHVKKFILEKGPLVSGYQVGVCLDTEEHAFFLSTLYGDCESVLMLRNYQRTPYENTDYIDMHAPQFNQQLIYNGRLGPQIKFLYREVTGGYLRNSFTQEVQYDLNESNIIGFKGARIEIIESSNRNITYKVIKPFLN